LKKSTYEKKGQKLRGEEESKRKGNIPPLRQETIDVPSSKGRRRNMRVLAKSAEKQHADSLKKKREQKGKKKALNKTTEEEKIALRVGGRNCAWGCFEDEDL